MHTLRLVHVQFIRYRKQKKYSARAAVEGLDPVVTWAAFAVLREARLAPVPTAFGHCLLHKRLARPASDDFRAPRKADRLVVDRESLPRVTCRATSRKNK